jgi:hypothetical protein
MTPSTLRLIAVVGRWHLGIMAVGIGWHRLAWDYWANWPRQFPSPRHKGARWDGQRPVETRVPSTGRAGWTMKGGGA